MSHHPTLYRAGRHGSWATCSCGWTSDTYRGVTGAHLAYGRHLLTAPSPDRSTTP